MLPFWISIALLSLIQGSIVALPRVRAVPRLARLRGRRWAVIPPLSVIAFVFVAGAAERASAHGLTYLALIAVPALAALALGWFTPAARPLGVLLVPLLFALAWIDRDGPAGECAALALSALSCVALGALLALVTPTRWLAAGIVTMAIADTALVVGDLLQRPQSALLGSAVMGYGDLFVAAALGALLSVAAARSLQLRAAVLCAILALSLDLLFFIVNELPATVPVALTLIVVALARRRRSAPTAPAPELQAPAARRQPPAPRPSAPDRPTPAAP